MRILICGGAGFIGSNMADFLINHGHQVIIVDNLTSGKKENINDLTNEFCDNILKITPKKYNFINDKNNLKLFLGEM